MDYRVIDADSHVNSPPDLWVSRVPSRFKDRAPKIVDLGGCDAWVVDGGKPSPITILQAAAGKSREEIARKVIHFDEMIPGAWDPKARLDALDTDGIDAQVLYGDGAMGAEDPELRLVLSRAYNDWLAEFCAVAPERYIGLAVLPIHDPEAAADEVDRVADLGLRGIFLGYDGADYPITAPEYDRFWATCAERKLPVSIHIGGGSLVKRATVTMANPAPGQLDAFMVFTPMTIAETLAKIIFSGLLERHPDLKVVMAEGGIGWLAYFVERIDHVMQKQGSFSGTVLQQKPSFYFRRQILATFEEDLAGMRTYDLIGVNNIMWASDYPHSDTTWPHSDKAIEEHFGSLPEDERRAMTCGNAGRLYGLID